MKPSEEKFLNYGIRSQRNSVLEKESAKALFFLREIYICSNGNNNKNKGDIIMKFWNKNYNEMTVVGIMAISPEARQTVKAKYVQVKNTIRRKLEKRG